MTFILSIGNSEQVIQISDRRLSANGKVFDDFSNKATCLTCRNGRFAIGYTGIAVVGKFKTQDWLLDSLFECASPEYAIYEMLERFATKASRDFNKIPELSGLSLYQKRISIMFTGYLYNSEKPLLGNLIVTNFQDISQGYDYPEAKKDFWIASELEKDNIGSVDSFVQRIGVWQSMTKTDENALRELLQNRKPQSALINKSVHLIRQMADRPKAQNMIGKNLIATIVPSDINKLCISVLKPYSEKDIYTFADNLDLLGDEDKLAIKEMKITITSPKSDAQENLAQNINKVRKKRKRH